MLLTADTKVGNRPYFTAIQHQMENGGYEAMLDELLHRDLTLFNVRDVPDSVGLQEQKKLSLPTPEAWWMDTLHRGCVWKSKLGLEDYFGEWHDVVTTEVLFASYTEFARPKTNVTEWHAKRSARSWDAWAQPQPSRATPLSGNTPRM